MTVPVRKFEMGCNTDYLGDFLEKCGWQVSKRVGAFKVRRIGSPGKWKTMSKAKLMEIFDQERIKLGLEPIQLFNVKQSKLKVSNDS